MPLDCDHRKTFGADACATACHAFETGAYVYARVDKAGELPPADPAILDVFVLDMNHGWPNIGHDAIVMAVRTSACSLADEILAAGLRVRVVSCDVRRGLVIPRPPDGRGGLYVGTGGPGHVDPARNDGGEGTQGIVESAAWESPVFGLFDAIQAHPDAALIGICHTFGVMSRWLGVADPVLRGPEKGGKSAGIVDSVLAPAAGQATPGSSGLARAAAYGRRIRVLDSRLYDLLPRPALPASVAALGYEADAAGAAGEAITMWESARDRTGGMPRVFGVNHHPNRQSRPRPAHPVAEAVARRSLARLVPRARRCDGRDAARRRHRSRPRRHVALHALRTPALSPGAPDRAAGAAGPRRRRSGQRRPAAGRRRSTD